MMIALTFLVFTVSSVNCFNVDTRNTVTFSGPRNSLFGYSGVLQNNWLITGAPRGNITGSPIVSPGVVYKCQVDFTLPRLRQCDPMIIQTPNVTDPRASQSNQFLGGSMIEITDKILVCAHLWKVYPANITNQEFPVGRCHQISKNLTEIDTNRQFSFTYDELYGGGYRAAFSMIGFSAAKSTDPLVAILGGPGLDEKGGFLRYRVDQPPPYSIFKAVDGDVTKLLLHQSYMGYSTAVARFPAAGTCILNPVLLGMPHFAGSTDGHVGSVVLVCNSTAVSGADMTILKQLFGNQIGAGFGYGIIVCDYNGDGKDDIMVSAPFQSLNRKTDVGTVFVFTGTGRNDFLMPVLTTLNGDEAEHGRFGTSMANLGDITADDVDDIAISAPYEEAGVVYVFNGRLGSLQTKYSQKIHGKYVQSGIMSFGLFITESRDMDSNKFQDFAVGSPLSDRITLLRTRPVVTVSAKLEVSPWKIPLNSSGLNCSDDNSLTPCTSVVLCFSFSGNRLELINTTDISYQLSVDTSRVSRRLSSRVHISFDGKKYDNTMTIESAKIYKDRDTCYTIYVLVTSVDRSFFASIDEELPIVMNYSLSEAPLATRILPVLNPNPTTTISRQVSFQTGCEGICRPNLQVSFETDQASVIYGESTDLRIRVNLINTNQPAFAPTVMIKFSNNTKFISYRALVEEGAIIVTCSEGDDNQTVHCNCNQLLQQQIAAFRLIFDVSVKYLQQGFMNITDVPTDIDFSVLASVSSGIDANLDNNRDRLNVPIEFQSALEINGVSAPEEIFISDKTEKVTFKHSFDLFNTGPSPMIASEVYLELPQYNVKTELILNWTAIRIDTDSSATNCSLIPSLNITFDMIENDTDVKGKKGVIKLTCSNKRNTKCVLVRCLTQELDVKASTRIDIHVDLTAKKISFKEISAVYYTSLGHVYPTTTRYRFRLLNNDSVEVTTELYPETPSTAAVEPVNIWIIIGAVFAGVVLLVILINVMWQCGFFKREKKQKVEEIKRKSNYYENRKTQRIEAERLKAMSKDISRSDEEILHHK